MYIAVAIIAFGLLIAIHELGHFAAAKLSGVKVNEFAIGMGPKILKKQGKETLYTLRLLPIGGFCAMEGEDGDSTDERAFSEQKRLKRVVILLAGSAANFVAGLVIVLILFSQITSLVGTTLTGFLDGFPGEGENGLIAGDTIVSINGERLYYSEDFQLFMALADQESGRVDLVIRRGGEKIVLSDFPLSKREYIVDGVAAQKFGLRFNEIEANAFERFKYSCYTAMNYVRLVRVSLGQLISGAAGLRDLSGPVGLVSAMNDRANEVAAEQSAGAALASIANFTAFIAINLAVMNLLPIPALDGGRILFIFLTWAVETVIRRRVDPKYEGYIHATAFVLLVGLMVFVLFNDVVKLIGQ